MKGSIMFLKSGFNGISSNSGIIPVNFLAIDDVKRSWHLGLVIKVLEKSSDVRNCSHPFLFCGPTWDRTKHPLIMSQML